MHGQHPFLTSGVCHSARFFIEAAMAKSKNHTNHNQGYKDHRHGIKIHKPIDGVTRKMSQKGVCLTAGRGGARRGAAVCTLLRARPISLVGEQAEEDQEVLCGWPAERQEAEGAA